MKFIAYFISLFVITSAFFACDENDNFSTDSNLRLSFSADTVRFDTVFTNFGSATKRFKIYNRNKDALTINNIELIGAGRTGFRMNVDGESGNKLSNVDILGKDSLYVFVEVTVDPLKENSPLLIADSIRFQFNGVTQYVCLEAIGQNVQYWKGKVIDKDTTLTDAKPFLIYDSLSIKKGVTLTVKENVYFYFHKDAKLYVHGSIHVVGTIEKPIVLRGDRMDNLFESPKVPYDRVHGQWGGIFVSKDSYDNRFENVRIQNGVYGIFFDASDVSKQKATLLNTIVQNTTKEGLKAINSKITAKNSLFVNSGGSTVSLIGGNYDFLHCTIANYMSSYWGMSKQPALLLANTGLDASGKTVSYPLENTSFINTIVAGASNAELKENKSAQIVFNRQFISCLLKIKGTDDTDFVNIVWGVDPLFNYIYLPASGKENPSLYYYYNFGLTKESPAVNKGARQYAVDLPFDIRGVSRRSDQAPDIGCYEWEE